MKISCAMCFGTNNCRIWLEVCCLNPATVLSSQNKQYGCFFDKHKSDQFWPLTCLPTTSKVLNVILSLTLGLIKGNICVYSYFKIHPFMVKFWRLTSKFDHTFWGIKMILGHDTIIVIMSHQGLHLYHVILKSVNP